MEAPENKQAWLAQMEAVFENSAVTYLGIEFVDVGTILRMESN